MDEAPENTEVCAACRGTAKMVGRTCTGPRFERCPECRGAGILVDWAEVEKEFEEMRRKDA